MSDYHQPAFYRFNQDSLLLVNEILKSELRPQSILDIGAGSGVIALELARKLSIPVVHFLELQRDWEEVLRKNISDFLPGHETKIFWSAASSWKPERKYELIVSNPPYYLPGKGQLSQDPVRAKCRSFLVDDWKIFGDKCLSALSPGGSGWFITLSETVPHIRSEWKKLPFTELNKGELTILRISSE